MIITFTDSTGKQITLEGNICPAELADMDKTKPLTIDGREAALIELGGRWLLAVTEESSAPTLDEVGTLLWSAGRADRALMAHGPARN